jgi:hypothetical protein
METFWDAETVSCVPYFQTPVPSATYEGDVRSAGVQQFKTIRRSDLEQNTNSAAVFALGSTYR